MEQEQLAKAAGVSGNTVRRIEGFDGPMDARLDTIRRLQRVFEAAGVEFIPGGARLHEVADVAQP
jgi:predicted transcriptional regulator